MILHFKEKVVEKRFGLDESNEGGGSDQRTFEKIGEEIDGNYTCSIAVNWTIKW